MLDLHAQEFRKQLAAGVPMAMGSDVGPFPHGTQACEFVLMVKYGMTALAALQADPVALPDLARRVGRGVTLRSDPSLPATAWVLEKDHG